ncbi:MAG: NADH-quinone oxidoreductase subunit M [Planctomycetes bacterium]|nr:NADH-quinone oxidoreductase subunit M [Planctomycetota bacterium]MBI3834649.1 NADH-quinone oxidoreductase subunit M [Planctomycetota bacterium]
MDHILSWTVFVPAIGALLCLFAPKRKIRGVAVITTVVALLLSLTLFKTFLGNGHDPSSVFGQRYGTLHHVERAPWIEVPGKFTIEYFLGIDGLGFPLFVLTTFVSFLACLASWNFDHWKNNKGERAYYILFLLLETGMLGVFVSLDFFLFYIFWEVMLLPMYFLIGVWGGPRKEYAAIKFFLFTLAGSVLMLVALVAMYFYSATAIEQAGGLVASVYRHGVNITHGTFDLIELATNPAIQASFASKTTLFLGYPIAPIMFMFLFIGFAIKLPSVPVHTWLPDAHVEAPTPISMILAGVLLKMGGYGFLRVCYPIFPEGGKYWAFTLATVGVVSILYGALCAMAQSDFKKLVAYSSVSHMGYVLLGIAVMTDTGFQGAMFQMIAHGVSSPMCFFLVGVIYDRAHHREINRFGGLWLTMPRYGTLATIGFFASLGLPGMCGFIGELWVLIGTFQAGAKYTWAYPMAILAASGVILTAGYILWLIRRVYLGKEREEYADYSDADPRETLILIPMAALCIAMGVLPMQTVFNYTNGTLNQVLAHVTGGQ